MYLKITLHSAAAKEIIKNYITFLDPGGINYVIIVGPTVQWNAGTACMSECALKTLACRGLRVDPSKGHGKLLLA